MGFYKSYNIPREREWEGNVLTMESQHSWITMIRST